MCNLNFVLLVDFCLKILNYSIKSILLSQLLIYSRFKHRLSALKPLVLKGGNKRTVSFTLNKMDVGVIIFM